MSVKHRPSRLNSLVSDEHVSKLKIGIVYARWNSKVIDSLVKGCMSELKDAGVVDVTTLAVPGSYELVYGAKSMISRMDAVICIGCLIKGSTMHFEYISEAVSQGIMSLQLSANVPIVYGVLSCLTENQALARAGLCPGEKDNHNHGNDWGACAVEMGLIRRYGHSLLSSSSSSSSSDK